MIFRHYTGRNHHKRGLATTLADVFAALVIGSSLLFMVVDSVYLLRRYIPALVQKVRSRSFSIEEDDPLDGKSINIVKRVNDNPMDKDDSQR